MRSKMTWWACFVGLHAILLVALAGCGGIPDKNQDPAKNNAASFRKDWKECAEDYPELASGAHIRQRIGCMNLKGWN
jgi:hypothetical protein